MMRSLTLMTRISGSLCKINRFQQAEHGPKVCLLLLYSNEAISQTSVLQNQMRLTGARILQWPHTVL